MTDPDRAPRRPPGYGAATPSVAVPPAQLIASVFAKAPAQARRAVRRAAMAGADWVELRLDRWPHDAALAPVLEASSLPCLLTCSPKRHGGEYEGSAARRRALLEAGLAAGASGVDLAHDDDWTPSPSPRLLVRSFHAPRGTAWPADLSALRGELLHDGGCAKIVLWADDVADCAPLLALLAATDQRREPTCAFAMGEAVAATRVLAAAFGAPWIYASVDAGAPTAPGQLDLRALRDLYRVAQLGPTTRLFGVLGRGVSDSFGPWLHNRAFRRLDVDGVYLPLDTARPGDAVALVPPRRRGGFSVTAPHKTAVASMCHRLEPLAEAAGAANTLVFHAGDQWVGANTDVHGVEEALRRAGVDGGDGAPAAVFGGGGAARAAAVALERLGFAPRILVRDPEGAAAREWGEARGVELGPLSAPALDALSPAVVINATPVVDRPVVDGWSPAPGTAALDMAYRVKTTPLLASVDRPVHGLEMFLTQAAWQLAAFTERSAPPLDEDELRAFCPVP